ncbi:hypothetical protein [Nocardioides panaciterrulae]|uniref:Uncharacterized protein n=1 Tax=Nocardioides panaciterrulae TaxID=661492 RepID=A0A7Y9E677_9ACTN|nr:hypothetical protein [Nocardioides panaciterrulae]NYD41973.1 hypothetical protein [Nocardioides panaciterrulae]
MATDEDDVRTQLFDALLSKVENDPYPSATMMDLIEEMADDEQRAAYCRVLLDKVQGDTFPSLDLIRRVSEMA